MAGQGLTISNTTPVINLAEIGRLDILDGLFGEVVVPPAVVDELLAKEPLFPKAAEAARSGRFRVESPAGLLLARGFGGVLHAGESECLALAMEHSGSLLLIDDLQARAFAAINGLTFTGTLGCLATAKSRGLIDAVAPLIDELRRSARFWISSRLEARVLGEAGEAPEIGA
jgi:predicted nucleic acid-binding protein